MELCNALLTLLEQCDNGTSCNNARPAKIYIKVYTAKFSKTQWLALEICSCNTTWWCDEAHLGFELHTLSGHHLGFHV